MEALCEKKCIASIGFNRKELKDNDLFRAKLLKFFGAFEQK
jgi:hypothetical protein